VPFLPDEQAQKNQLRVGNGHHGFHAVDKIEAHPVDRTEEEFRVSAVFKTIDTSVFQKTPD